MSLSSGDTADEVVRLALSGTEITLRLAASATKNLAMLTLALGKNHKKLSGKTNLRKMLKETREIQTISLTPEQYKLFQKRAAKYKILYATIRDRQNVDRNMDVLLPVSELSRANLLMERIGLGEKPKQTKEEHSKNGSRWEPGWSDTRNNPTCSKQKDGTQRTNDQKHSIEAKLEGYRQSSSRGGNKTRRRRRGVGAKQREGL